MLNDYLHNDPELPGAWSPWFAHEYLAYFSVGASDDLMSLPPVSVKANPGYGEKRWPTGPKHIDVYKESYQIHRQLDPFWSFDHKKRNGDFALHMPSGKTIEPWKILIIYSTEPDLYADDDLILHKNQRVTGGSHGWRHMYFKLMGTIYGVAPQSFRVHKDLAALAFENREDYWGWRYLARGAHYLADLGHPFHVKGLPGSFLIRNYFTRREIFRIVSALHQSYEIYVERRFREGFEPFKQALLQGAREGQSEVTDAELQAYIKRSKKRHNPVFYYLLDRFGRELLEAFAKSNEVTQLDAAACNNRCSMDAVRVLFKDENLPKLAFLDDITCEILTDVGRMQGALFNGFASRVKSYRNR